LRDERLLDTYRPTGEIYPTFDEQITTLQEFYSADPTANVLWDFRGHKGNRISSEEVQKIISLVKSYGNKRPKGKTALVSNKDLDFGLSRVSEAYANIENLPWEIRSFRSMDEALKWINDE
jgi:uncharacterized protein YbgA (DUF1722 family)